MVNIFFSDFFGIKPQVVDEYGAVDISLVNDIPLFVDPFLLFSSERAEYRELHGRVIGYMRYLKGLSPDLSMDAGLIGAYFSFPEVRQTWLGFSERGNSGRGLGRKFADALHASFQGMFSGFGGERITRGSHAEKLCLVRRGIGKDMISDLVTNLIVDFLADYTQSFAREFLGRAQVRQVSVPRARFDAELQAWLPGTYTLPSFDGDYVLLTPKDILTKDDAWINRKDLLGRFDSIASSIPNAALRAQLDSYLRRRLGDDPTQEERIRACESAIEQFPDILDYYIRSREDSGRDARDVSLARVDEARTRFIENVRWLARERLEPGGFYDSQGATYLEAMARVMFLKDVIENKGGHRVFYVKGRPVERESDLHVMYSLVWFGSRSNVSREVNDGRGAVDFMVSRGSRDKTLVEFKLASNTKLQRNLERQVGVYEGASEPTEPSIKCILYFSESQLRRVQGILGHLGSEGARHIVLIDARADNKPSASVA